MLHTYVRHASEGEFQLATPGTFVRDLGVGDLTGGELTAQVVRIEPEGAYIEELHRHDEGFSLAYVLKGWLDVEFEEIGVQHLGPGTVIPAYNGPRHHELACGDGFELCCS
jgi:quercetin dioxygenase-like cupin family protein